MPKKTFNTRANKFFRPIAISIISLLLVAGIVKAATTVGTNISSDGTLTIAGTATFSGNMTVGNAGSDALVLNSGVWTLGSSATTTIAMTNGINFDSNTFVIDPSSGRVGIGTMNPARLLDVNGAMRVDETEIGSRILGWQYGGEILFNQNDLTMQAGANDDLIFKSGGTNELVRFKENGNVGIATTSPASTLDLGQKNNGTDSYMQIDSEAGAPPAADCDNISESGRMIIDHTNHKLYICNQLGGRGWDSVDLTD